MTGIVARMICRHRGHRMEWRRGRARYSDAPIMRGRCVRCGHHDSAIPRDTAEAFLAACRGAYPELQQFVRDATCPDGNT